MQLLSRKQRMPLFHKPASLTLASDQLFFFFPARRSQYYTPLLKADGVNPWTPGLSWRPTGR